VRKAPIKKLITKERTPFLGQEHAPVGKILQHNQTTRFLGTHSLDHVIVLNENHLRRILVSYLDYYHRHRTHLSLGKDTPRWAAGSER